MNRELDSMILTGPFQLKQFYNSMTSDAWKGILAPQLTVDLSLMSNLIIQQ